ncbi:MAG TPA: hypothetical protein VGV36_02920 [Solirubrobacteraceae bacterium]|nr:hypothetical protein [Solirubrobacteraceae bacterium]
MSRYRIPGLVLAAVAVLAVAFVALRPGDDEGTTSPAPSDVPVATSPAPSPETTTQTTEPAPEPEPPLLEPDATQDLRVDKGETVRFRVRSPQDDEIHVHGYDLTKEVPGGETVTMRFPADIEGIFEIELEQSGTALGELRVDP